MTNVLQLRLDEPEMLALCDASVLAHVRAFFFCAKRETNAVLTSTELARCYIRPAQRRDLIEKGVWGEAEDGGAVIRGFAQLDTTGTEVQVSGQGDSNGIHRKLASLRQARWRQSKRLQASTQPSTGASTGPTEASTPTSTESSTGPSTASTDTTGVSPTPPSSPSGSGSSLPPNPESSSVLASDPKDLTGSARARRSKRRTTLPDDWKPTAEHVKRATESSIVLTREVARFRAYHEARGSLMANWNAAFTTWLLNAVEFARPPGAVQHEQRRQEDARRPYHEPFKPERSEPKVSPAEALAAIQRAAAGIGRRMPA